MSVMVLPQYYPEYKWREIIMEYYRIQWQYSSRTVVIDIYLRYVSDYVTHTHLYFQETDFRDPHEMTNGFRDCRMSNLTSVYTQRVPRSGVASGSADVAMLYSYVTQRVETRV